MKRLTYKIMPNIPGWLHVTKKYNHMPLSKTWRAPKNTTNTEPARTLRARLTIGRNRNSPPSPDVILAQVNCSDDQIRLSLEEKFQVPGRTETVRGRGANSFTPRRSLISHSKSDVRGSKLNTAHRYNLKNSHYCHDVPKRNHTKNITTYRVVLKSTDAINNVLNFECRGIYAPLCIHVRCAHFT